MGTQSAEWRDAARVLRRIGFGATGHQVDKVVESGGPESAVAEMLAFDMAADAGVDASPMPEFKMLRKPKSADPEVLTRYYKERTRQMRDLYNWWVQRMVRAENPSREKLTFLWHNHFATSAAKVTNAALLAAQNETIRHLCLGDFQKLAYAMLTDAAMVQWLDAKDSVAKSPNENLSREFLELFALGHGNGYTETDVKEGARALTGWRIGDNGKAKFQKDRHDGDSKTVLGVTGDLDAKAFCSIVVQQPGSAQFLATRLWQQLASDAQPSARVVDRLVGSYLPNRDLLALTSAILNDPEFSSAHGTMVNGPVDWLIGSLRSFRVQLDRPSDASKFSASLKTLGQLPFYPPSVGGWPRGRSWLSTASVSARFEISAKMVELGDISVVEDAPESERLDAIGYLIGVGHWTNSTAKALKELKKNPLSLAVAAVNAPEYLTV